MLREVFGCFFFFLGNEGSHALIRRLKKGQRGRKRLKEGRSAAEDEGTRHNTGLAASLFSGGIAGVSYWASIFPLDTVKSRMQVKLRRYSFKFTPIPPFKLQVDGGRSTYSVAVNMWRANGAAAFYRGFAPCVLRAFPACAALFAAYEYSKRALESTILRERE